MFKVLVALLCVSSIFANSVVFQKFQEFTHKFEKTYSSMEEYLQKFENFKANLIEVLAADTFSGKHTKGITKFSDLSKAEFKAQYLTLKKAPSGFCDQAKKATFLRVEAPESLDWRAKGKVSPVKDQGQCGSCWAFSTIAFLESQWLIKNNSAQTFSEQQLVDCDRATDQGCNGGLMHTAFAYIQEKGIEGDDKYPYRARDQRCAYNAASVKAHDSNVQCLEDVDVNTLKSTLASVGPLAIAVDANDFQMYDSGILECTGTDLDHGVLLVGYGTENGTPFWIIKNSWGKNWGEHGFVRVSQAEGANCAVGAYVSTATLN
jgi:C1A family cysteine protease